MKATVTRVGDREIRIERTFNAPLKLVWRAMTEPKLIAQWWGRGNKLEVERYEFERGGHWRYVEHADHGAFGFEGRFGEIDPLKRTVLTFEWDGMPAHVCLNTAHFEAHGHQTKVIPTSLFMTKEDCEGMLHSGMEAGMNASHQALDGLLARMPTET